MNLSPHECVVAYYADLAKAYRWTHNEIDGMELGFLLDMLIAEAKAGKSNDMARLEQML